MDEKLTSALETCKSLSELALKLFDRNHQSARNKCKQILEENGVNWEEWLKRKKHQTKTLLPVLWKRNYKYGLSK